MVQSIDAGNADVATASVGSSAAVGKTFIAFLLLFVVVMLQGCATSQTAQLPPLPANQGGKIEPGKFVWVDLLTESTDDAAAFYGGLFGWTAAPWRGDNDYLLFSLDGTPIAGLTEVDNSDDTAPESWWLLSLSVSDVDKAVMVAKRNGGNVLEGPVNDGSRGRMALISDPSGAPLILLSGAGSHGVDEATPLGAWFWTDLYTRDAQSAEVFYTALAGFQTRQIETADSRYFVLTRNGTARAGVVELGWDDLQDNWLPYVRVADINATIAKARELGGNVLTQSGDVAILVDPTGAAFGIQVQ